tara:strand:+ start:386 stop:586 length:201 start_codon:yes stop_codon:yes gene_type:complete
MIWHQVLVTVWVYNGSITKEVLDVICVQDNLVVVNKQMVNVVIGVYQLVYQLSNLKFGQVAAVEQE